MPGKKSGVAPWVWIVVAAAVIIPVIAVIALAARQEDRTQDQIDDILEDIPDNVNSQSGDTYGDNPTLDALWDRCEDGDGGACDQLYYSSEFNSEYEEFGNTCGRRFELSDVPLSCAEALS